MERQIVEHTSPAWRLIAVALFFGGLFFGGWAARILGLVDQFSTFFVITFFVALGSWARKRPDKLRRRFGAFGKVALAVQESADDIRASIYSRSIYYGVLFGAAYAVLVIAAKAVVVAVATSLYAWQLTAMAACITAAVVVAPQFFSGLASRMSIPDDECPEKPRPREVGSRDGSEIERGAVVSGKPENREEHTDMDETKRNSEAKFASPDGSSEGIGYYFEGELVSPEEFERLVEEKAERLRDEGNEER